MLSVTTDYASGTGCPEAALRRISQANFSHIHWCHQWCTDFLYCDAEVRQIKCWLAEFGLQVCDVHGSAGREKAWSSRLEYERLAGLDLIRNRLWFAAELGADVVIMHLPSEPEEGADDPGFHGRLRHSLDALIPDLERYGVRVAFENMSRNDFSLIGRLLNEYSEGHFGLCYDSGHGNMNPGNLEPLDALRHRLISVHLHDNDGVSDQHQPPFMGTVDWPGLARIIARSSYTKPLSFEVATRASGIEDEDEFLAFTHRRATDVADLVALERTQLQ